ncbi:MAG: von Willebrand factor type domain protein [Labilithrix sp.]|nr:von Willebrand factor type domain protein [Labilithrix sp.]
MRLNTLLCSLLALFSLLFVSCAQPVEPTLDLTPTAQMLISGQPLQLTVTRRFPGGAIEDVTNRVTYTTSDRSIANVNDRGVVVAGPVSGTAVIKAFDSSSDATALATVSVTEPLITSIDVSPAVLVMTRSAPARGFTATARFNNGSTGDVTSQVLWSSTNTAVAIVGNSQLDRGIVRPVADGDTSILATDAKTGVAGRATVFVTGGAATLQAILVTPNPAQVAVGTTQDMTALGVYSDGAARNLSAMKMVTWSSSRPDVATVDAATGTVTGVIAGDTTITATGPEPTTTVKGSAAMKVIP